MPRKQEYEELTPRLRTSQRIMREKAARKKREAFMRKTLLIGGGIASVFVLGTSLWLWKSGSAVRGVQAMVDGSYAMTVRSGFSLQSLYLEGRNRTAMHDIEEALGVKKGDPILRLSLSDLRERLERIESVKYAAVERALPDTLYVRIIEREPVALWQKDGKIALVDDNGVVMTGIDITPYKQLPLIIGDGAPEHIGELMKILATEPELAKRFAAAIYVSDRRWNIRLNVENGSDIEIKLPETNPSDAWKKLANLHEHQQVLDRDVRVIDLRLEGKMFIKLTPEHMQGGKSSNARET